MPKRVADLTGQRFGRLLTVRVFDRQNGHVRWLCQCDCGETTIVLAGNLARGNTKSCGCFRRDFGQQLPHLFKSTHGHKSGSIRTHGGSRTYRSWRAMIQRCHDANSPAYEQYGARAISVTKPWRDSFAAFLNDMGERPEGTSIDRIDGRFGYFPANCRWATMQQQHANKRKPIKRSAKWQALMDARPC